jgi:hypothetical protein
MSPKFDSATASALGGSSGKGCLLCLVRALENATGDVTEMMIRATISDKVNHMILKKVISGGQTGVDRAALDAAIESNILIGGFCPKGRLSEDGTIPERYPLVETVSKDYSVRTEMNVMNADGTLILTIGTLTGGTKLTAEYAERHHKPFRIVHLVGSADLKDVARWIISNEIKTMNVAGPRESGIVGGIYTQAHAFLMGLFASSL